MTDSDSAAPPIDIIARSPDTLPANAPAPALSGDRRSARRRSRPDFPELAPPLPQGAVTPKASLAPVPGQTPLWVAGVWTTSPLMRSLIFGVTTGLIGAGLAVWLFDNIFTAIAAYAIFGAVGILVMALK